MIKIRYLFIILFSFLCQSIAYGSDLYQPQYPLNQTAKASPYLYQPTGNYGVGFEDFYWINQNVCPDPFWTGENVSDFRPDNPNRCHEMMLRVYYPIDSKGQQGVFYNNPLNKSLYIEILNQDPNISPEQIAELDQLRSFSVGKAKISREPSFPVLIFSPGSGVPVSAYENFITETVSHGYILVGINSSFINISSLPDGHIINASRPESENDEYKNYLSLQIKDINFVYNALHSEHSSNDIFKKMDLKHIGAFGHSIGARSITDITYINPSWFKAGATLDIATYFQDDDVKGVSIPFMHMMSANWRNPNPILNLNGRVSPVDLNNMNYLIQLRPTEKNYGFTQHLNETDLSTLQYLQAFQSYASYIQKQASVFSLQFMSHIPTKYDRKHFDKSTWAFIKTKQSNQWSLTYYLNGIKESDIPVMNVEGLDIALSQLPDKKPEELTPTDVIQVQKVMAAFNMLAFGVFLGTADGWELTQSMNIYLTHFFDTYIKGIVDPAFQRCVPLSQNVLLNCGPGIF